jgi:hypothetical protein
VHNVTHVCNGVAKHFAQAAHEVDFLWVKLCAYKIHGSTVARRSGRDAIRIEAKIIFHFGVHILSPSSGYKNVGGSKW